MEKCSFFKASIRRFSHIFGDFMKKNLFAICVCQHTSHIIDSFPLFLVTSNLLTDSPYRYPNYARAYAIAFKNEKCVDSKSATIWNKLRPRINIHVPHIVRFFVPSNISAPTWYYCVLYGFRFIYCYISEKPLLDATISFENLFISTTVFFLLPPWCYTFRQPTVSSQNVWHLVLLYLIVI